MLDIRLNGESVDRLPGSELVLERFNPLFSFDTVMGSRVYDFKLPDTPTNRRILGHPHHAQTMSNNRKYFAEKYQFGSLVEQGTVQVRESSPEYSLYFTQDLGQMFGDYQQRLLSELVELGSEPVPVNPALAPTLDVSKFCFPTILNPSFYGNATVAGFQGRVNHYQNGAYNVNARIPQFFAKWVLTRIGELSGWSFTGTWWQSEHARRLLLFNLYSLDGATTITYANHLPAIRARDLILELRKAFNLYIDVDVRNRVITLDNGDEVLLRDTTQDWTDKAVGEYVKLPDGQGRMAFSSAIASNDATLKPVPGLLEPYITPGTEGTLIEVKSGFSSLLTDATTGLPKTDMAGYSPLNKESKGDSANRLLYYIGTLNSTPVAGNTYTTSTLGWTGPNGLVSQYWKQYEAFRLRTHQIRRGLWLNQADMAMFSFRNKVHIRGVDYVVGSLKVALGDEAVSKAEAELWRW